GLPRNELSRAGLPVPGTALRVLGLELEQVTRERGLEPGEGRLCALGRAAERRHPAARRRGHRIAPSPALEQAAEGKCRDLAGAQLLDQLRGGGGFRCMLGEDVRPLNFTDLHGLVIADVAAKSEGQTSTTTGRIIGLRRVRSKISWPT